jgi:uncharacterized protein (DUF1800 family)
LIGMSDFSRADVAHLLRRAAFGGSAAEIDALMALSSWEAVVDRVLDTSANPPDPIPAAVESRTDPWYGVWVAGVHHWIDRMVTSPTPVVEKLTLFWHSNLASSRHGALPRLVFKQVRTYRSLCMGDLETLMQAMAVDPAMLNYLDNARNMAGATNENFARELMELFLLGNGTFTEADVVAMARAWTGHGLDSTGERYQFHANEHDPGNKTIFGITRAWNGPETITEMVRGSRQQTCARFIATKLWSFYAAPDPTAAIVDGLAQAFIAGNMEVRALLRAIFLRPEFRLAATRTALVRSPVEWMAAGMRSTGMRSSVVRPEWYLDRLGHVLYQPPNVSGWRQNGAWISTSVQWGKGTFASFMASRAKDAGVLAETQNQAPALAVQAAFDLFGVDDPSPATRARLEEFVTRERTASRRWAIPAGLITLTMLSPDVQLA